MWSQSYVIQPNANATANPFTTLCNSCRCFWIFNIHHPWKTSPFYKIILDFVIHKIRSNFTNRNDFQHTLANLIKCPLICCNYFICTTFFAWTEWNLYPIIQTLIHRIVYYAIIAWIFVSMQSSIGMLILALHPPQRQGTCLVMILYHRIIGSAKKLWYPCRPMCFPLLNLIACIFRFKNVMVPSSLI